MKKYLKSKTLFTYLFIATVVLALMLRVHGANWDQNQHLHPDERFLTMVTTDLNWPENLRDFFNTNKSTLNPHNINYSFYVYGTFPLFFTKAVTDLINKTDYNTLTIAGRYQSAIIDTLIVILVFLITYKITKKKLASLLAMFLYSVSVLPIQLSHFYTVDSFLTFFIVLSFYLSLFVRDVKNFKYKTFFAILTAISFGLAFASKLQALFFLPILTGGLVLYTLDIKYKKSLIILFAFAIFSFMTIRLAQPYLFAGENFISFRLNPKVIANWKDLNGQYSDKTYLNADSVYFPPATMFIHAKDYIFPLENIVLWGSGVFLGLSTIAGVAYLFIKKGVKFKDRKNWPIILVLCWVIYFSLYQAQLFAKYLRYFYILYPFYAIVAGIFLYDIYSKRFLKIITISVPILTLIWAFSFDSIYSKDNSRIMASRYIYENIPAGSTISYEHWDDGLPLCLKNYPCGVYRRVEFPLYDKDTPEKWIKMQDKLNEVDYIILSSNRLYGSIMTVPEIYPETNKFYQSLFNGSLGFKKIAEFTSRPNIPIPIKGVCITPPWIWYGKVARNAQECNQKGISFVDDYADESFTVYDHPKVIIFKKQI